MAPPSYLSADFVLAVGVPVVVLVADNTFLLPVLAHSGVALQFLADDVLLVLLLPGVLLSVVLRLSVDLCAHRRMLRLVRAKNVRRNRNYDDRALRRDGLLGTHLHLNGSNMTSWRHRYEFYNVAKEFYGFGSGPPAFLIELHPVHRFAT
jgi:hypothetical protein